MENLEQQIKTLRGENAALGRRLETQGAQLARTLQAPGLLVSKVDDARHAEQEKTIAALAALNTELGQENARLKARAQELSDRLMRVVDRVPSEYIDEDPEGEPEPDEDPDRE